MNTTTSVPITNGHGNGHAYGTVSPPPTESNPASGSDISSEDGHHDPGSSSGYYGNGFAEAQYRPTHNEEIVNHLYHSGFQTGNYADTILHVHQNVYRLHAIILARSPFLAHLMSTSPQGVGPRTIFVPLEHEPEVTQEGFAIALGYLYSSVSISVMRPENARAVLAAGCLLGGMDDLCQTAYEVCRQSISVETIGSWLEFLDTLPSPRPVHSGTSTGTSTPVLSVPQLNTVFGPYAQRIRDDVFHFLIVALPQILEVNHAPSEDGTGQDGRRVLIDIFSRVPFEMFKTAIESPSFLIGSEQARFKFAKDAIEIRKRGIARAGGDEHVVLAFGGGNAGSAVHVTRKLRKRPLWKVNA